MISFSSQEDLFWKYLTRFKEFLKSDLEFIDKVLSDYLQNIL